MEKHNKGIFIPNEIFNDLQENLSNVRKISFAYSYYVYIHFLFRHCKHVDANGEYVTQGKIKEYLGYSPNNKEVNSIIKKDGLLDQMGYTFTSTDYPLCWHLDDDNDVRFIYISDIKELFSKLKMGNNFRIKVPKKGFHRNNTDELNGTFYNTEDTHFVEIGIMNEIMTKIGTTGFYLYGYLSYRIAIYKNGYQVSLEQLCEETKMNIKTLKMHLKKLREEEFIIVTNEKYESGRNVDFSPNIYQLYEKK